MVFLASAIFAVDANAISLGTYPKSDTVFVSAGSYATVDILFWNTGAEKYSVELESLRQPEGWYVVAVPKKFEIGPGVEYSQKENLLLPGQSTPIVARIVRAVVSVPLSAKEGEYEIALQALAGGGEGVMSVSQARVFRFHVHVENSGVVLSSEQDAEKPLMTDFEETGQGIVAREEIPPAQETSGNGRVFFIVVATILILYISGRIVAKK